jgi:hypothetical protein
MSIINYEDTVEAALIDGLKSKFGIEDNVALIKYLFSRCAIFHGANIVNDDAQFMHFVLQELCIPYRDPNSGYKTIVAHINGEDIVIDSGFSNQNSLLNIFESMSGVFMNREYANKKGEFLSPDSYLKTMLSDIQRRSTLKLKPYKNSHYKNELQTLFKLQCLNEDFCIKTPNEAPLCPMFDQRDIRTSIETLYERYLHAENFDTTNVHSVTEAQVRDYLYIHLDLIEDGLKPIMKEFPTKEGRVDIVARDRDDNLVVIELKTENDKRLIWQCMYYPDEIKKKLGQYDEDKKVRMLTIAPEYPEFILKPIEKLGYVESFTYTIKAFNNTIEDICVEKFESDERKSDDIEAGVSADLKNKLDHLIRAFIYTRQSLGANNEFNMNDRDLNETALKLVEMACGMENVENKD